MGRLKLRREVVELVRKYMPVSIHRDVDAGVAKVMLDCLGVDSPAN
jgi:hypothetical protein